MGLCMILIWKKLQCIVDEAFRIEMFKGSALKESIVIINRSEITDLIQKFNLNNKKVE